MLSQKEILEYLSVLRNLKKEYTLYDMHVHPFEIIYNSFVYDKDPGDHGLYCFGNVG
jgi:hypothetical protein